MNSCAMSETPTLQIIAPTPLASVVGENPKPPELIQWQSVQTPRVFDSEKSELAALLHKAAVHDLGWLRRVSVTGSDRQRWLSGMVTNAAPEIGSGNYNFILSAQGRIQGDLYTWQAEDRFLLETTASQLNRIVVHLDRYIIMDDVELKPLEDETALGLSGPKAAELLASAGVDVEGLEPLTLKESSIAGIKVSIQRAFGVLVPHYELWVKTSDLAQLWQELQTRGAIPAGLAALEQLRVLEAIPLYGIDLGEKDLPQESSQVRALHFSKGCYIGQEIVERIRSRGNVHRSLRQFRLSGSFPQQAEEIELKQGEAVVAQLTSVVKIPQQGSDLLLALGIVRGEALIRKAPLEYQGGTAEVLEAPPSLDLQ